MVSVCMGTDDYKRRGGTKYICYRGHALQLVLRDDRYLHEWVPHYSDHDSKPITAITTPSHGSHMVIYVVITIKCSPS